MAYPPQQGPYGPQVPQGQQQYGGYPQQPGPYGAPPPKNKAPLIASLLFVVALLAGLGITGFVAPGFFLSDDDDKSGGSASDGSASDGGASGGSEDPDLKKFAADLVAAANDQDKSALKEFPCDDAGPGVSQAINEIDETEGAELVGVKELAADKYVILVDIAYDGKHSPFSATVAKSGDAWCWQDFARGTGGSSGGDSGDDSGDDSDGPASGPGGSSGDSGDSSGGNGEEGKTLVEEFITAVNAKDSAKANSMYCDDAPSNSLVDHVIKKDPKLAVGSIDESKYFLKVKLSGTLGGKPLNLGNVSVKLTGSGAPCVFTFGAG